MPGNARRIALSIGVLLLSAIIAVVAGLLGLVGFAAGDSGGRLVQARVVEGVPCATPGAMEVVSFTVDGEERRAKLDGCGHQPDEPLSVMVDSDTADQVVREADAATGRGRYGQRLGEVLLALAGIAGATYALLLRRGPRGTPLLPRVVPSGN